MFLIGFQLNLWIEFCSTGKANCHGKNQYVLINNIACFDFHKNVNVVNYLLAFWTDFLVWIQYAPTIIIVKRWIDENCSTENFEKFSYFRQTNK